MERKNDRISKHVLSEYCHAFLTSGTYCDIDGVVNQLTAIEVGPWQGNWYFKVASVVRVEVVVTGKIGV